MRKSNKTRKKTDADIQIIEKIKECINRYSSASNLIRNVEFEELADKDSLRFSCKIDFGDFEETVVYYSAMLMTEHMIDAEFVYKNSSYIYTFYDIFNLFDIDDFNLYYARDMLSCDDVEKIINDIFNATEKYFNYIEKAGTSKYLPKLIKNYETDMTAVMGGNDWEGEEIYDPFILPFNHPYFSVYDGRITLKLHKKLQKRNSKGELELIYEKRLLKYLEKGLKNERKEVTNKADFLKLYKRKTVLIYFLIFLISLAVCILLEYIFHSVIYRGADVYLSEISFFGIDFSLPYGITVFGIASALWITLVIGVIFGGKIISKVMPSEFEKSAYAKFEKDVWGRLKNKFVKVLLIIFFVFCGVFSFVYGFVDVGYYDDYVRFINGSLNFADVKYENLQIYKIKGESGNNKKYDNAYAISDKNTGCYFEFEEVDPNGQTQKKLNEIAEQYNIEIIVVESINDLS